MLIARVLFSLIALVACLAHVAMAEPAPPPPALSEPGMNPKAAIKDSKKKALKATKAPLPHVPAGPTPFDAGNAPETNN